jgi:hypothetical protein
LFIPSTRAPGNAAPLIVDLHGLNITPLMQMLFDGTVRAQSCPTFRSR